MDSKLLVVEVTMSSFQCQSLGYVEAGCPSARHVDVNQGNPSILGIEQHFRWKMVEDIAMSPVISGVKITSPDPRTELNR